jgi:hypothetical protein
MPLKTTLFAALTLLACLEGLAAPPKLDSLFPAGGQRSQQVTVTAAGTFATWPAQVWVNRDGIQVECDKDKGKLKVTIGGEAAAGTYWLRVHDAEGASTLRPFLVDSLPELEEKEPNNVKIAAQELEQSSIVNGRLQSGGDVDAFSISAKAGQILVASLQANHVLASPMDGVLQICSADGFVLEQNDDARGIDPQIAFEVPRDGKYLIRTFAFPLTPNSTIGFAGADTFLYRLTVTTGGFVDHAVPLALQPEQESALSLFGWNLPEDAAGLAKQATHGEYLVAYRPELSSSIQLSPSAHSSIAATADSTREQPQALSLPAVITGRIDEPRDEDVFQFKATKGQKITFRVESDSLGFLLDPLLQVLAADGKVIGGVDDSNRKRDCELTQTIPADGDYRVLVRDVYRHGGFRYVYRLTAAEATPDFALKLAADSFVLTAGKPLEVPITVQRKNGFNGEIEIAAKDLPEGVTADVVKSEAKGDSSKAVKLVLKSDAGPISSPFQVVGTCKEPAELTHHASFALGSSTTQCGLPWLTVVKAK